jgi:hypothetical protein
MGSFFVIALKPLMRDFPHFLKRCEQPAIEHLGSVRSVKALDEGVLIRFARLYETQFNTLVLAPIGQILRGQFRAIVEPYRLG